MLATVETLVMATLVGGTPRLEAVAVTKAERTESDWNAASVTPASDTPA